jgi:hypothetical protein
MRSGAFNQDLMANSGSGEAATRERRRPAAHGGGSDVYDLARGFHQDGACGMEKRARAARSTRVRWRRRSAQRGGRHTVAGSGEHVRRCRPRGRERATQDAPSPPREAQGGLLVDGQEAARQIDDGSRLGFRLGRRRWRARSYGSLGKRTTWCRAVPYIGRGVVHWRAGPGIARGAARPRVGRTRARVWLGHGASGGMTGGSCPSAFASGERSGAGRRAGSWAELGWGKRSARTRSGKRRGDSGLLVMDRAVSWATQG